MRSKMLPPVHISSSTQFSFSQMMSTNMASGRILAGGAVGPNTTTVGSSKPLHRFIRAEPKSNGIVMLFMGSSLFIFAIPMKMSPVSTSAEHFAPFWLGILFIICGLLYLLTEKSPSKALVTASLALSIMSILGVVVAFFEFLKGLIHTYMGIVQHNSQYYLSLDETETSRNNEEFSWRTYHTNQLFCLEAIFMCQSLLSVVILIVMTAFAKAALQSSRTQAIVVMHDLPSPD
ncbi:hypothetical protein UPYG_G00327440 [Umbra pygmaea]|uniref:Uncharacterized protein n=1 Tax=Umbra pygmaea TaxID=75934 RepID=A0ABD0W2F7_UMBPY